MGVDPQKAADDVKEIERLEKKRSEAKAFWGKKSAEAADAKKKFNKAEDELFKFIHQIGEPGLYTPDNGYDRSAEGVDPEEAATTDAKPRKRKASKAS